MVPLELVFDKMFACAGRRGEASPRSYVWPPFRLLVRPPRNRLFVFCSPQVRCFAMSKAVCQLQGTSRNSAGRERERGRVVPQSNPSQPPGRAMVEERPKQTPQTLPGAAQMCKLPAVCDTEHFESRPPPAGQPLEHAHAPRGHIFSLPVASPSAAVVRSAPCLRPVEDAWGTSRGATLSYDPPRKARGAERWPEVGRVVGRNWPRIDRIWARIGNGIRPRPSKLAQH